MNLIQSYCLTLFTPCHSWIKFLLVHTPLHFLLQLAVFVINVRVFIKNVSIKQDNCHLLDVFLAADQF